MREIKFKYICKRTNGYVFSEIFTLEQIEQGAVKSWMELNFIGGSDIVYKLQYTGLKDKNGKEIYEGDILNWTICGVVTYEKDTFWAITPLGSHYHIDDGVEVIGNTYENPELLEI